MPFHPALVLPFVALSDATRTADKQGGVVVFARAEGRVAL